MNEQLGFLKELESLINRYSRENESNTPDFILTTYINDCLKSYESAITERDKWFNVDMWTVGKIK